MTFQCAFDRDNLRRVQILQDAKYHLLANGSQQNAQNKIYSCLETNCFGKWEEFHAKKHTTYSALNSPTQPYIGIHNHK